MDVPVVQYAQTDDDVSIAFQIAGQGFPIVLMPHSSVGDFTFLPFPLIDEFAQALSERGTILSYDSRGAGNSAAWDSDYTLEVHLADLDAVVRAAQLDRFVLVGQLHSGPTAMHYAATHPDIVAGLILVQTFLDGPSYFAEAAIAKAREVMLHDQRMYLEIAILNAHLPPELVAPVIDLSLRLFPSGERGLAFLTGGNKASAREIAPDIKVPTLVLHRRECVVPVVQFSHELASAIPGAQLQMLEGNSYLLAVGDQAETVSALASLSREPPPEPADAPGSARLRTILFTDVENSTDLVVQHGDAKYRELLADHERLVREALAEHGGNEIKTIGDSFMCWFSSASAALDAASAMQRKISDHYGDGIRIGIHAGEPIQEADGDLYGTSVVRASRIMGQADGGQILVSQVVTDLVEGKSYLFSDAGEFALKGYERAVHLFDVAWEAE